MSALKEYLQRTFPEFMDVEIMYIPAVDYIQRKREGHTHSGQFQEVCVHSIKQASRVRSFTTTTKVWRLTKNDATRGHQYQAKREMRTAKGRHNYGRKIFEIDKMCVN